MEARQKLGPGEGALAGWSDLHLIENRAAVQNAVPSGRHPRHQRGSAGGLRLRTSLPRVGVPVTDT